jgi:hypothetical protein
VSQSHDDKQYEAPEVFFVSFAENGNIRQWNTTPFEGSCRYVREVSAPQSATKPIKEVVAELRAKNGKRSCDCTSCDCGNYGDAQSVASWDGADWILNEIEKAIQ